MLYPCTRFHSLKIRVFLEFSIYINFKIATTQDLIILFSYFAHFSCVWCILHRKCVLIGSLHNCMINILSIAFQSISMSIIPVCHDILRIHYKNRGFRKAFLDFE